MRVLGRASTTPETEPPDEPGARVRGRRVEVRWHPDLGSAPKAALSTRAAIFSSPATSARIFFTID